MDRRRDENENMVALYEVSFTRCVNTLNTLIQKDALILHKVLLTSFNETPLHIIVLLGHLEFTRTLLNKKCKLAKEVDSWGQTPLHLASAEGHTKIVKALLEAYANVCLVCDEYEKLPLHLAAMRGQVKVVKELIIAQRDSMWMNFNGDSVLHLCIRHNHLDTLKFLLKFANHDELFLNSKDQDGNSILHLAMMLKQIKTIKYLLSILEIKRKANAVNRIGNTAFDVLEIHARDFRFYEIHEMLKEAGVRRSKDLNFSPLMTPNDATDEAQEVQSKESARSICRRWWQYSLKTFKYDHTWMEYTRGTLMVVATVIATMSFQAGVNPPGGVWQDCENRPCEPGITDKQLVFLTCNTLFFLASMSGTLAAVAVIYAIRLLSSAIKQWSIFKRKSTSAPSQASHMVNL